MIVFVSKSRCGEYSASSKTPSDSQEPHEPESPLQNRSSETASASNHSSAQTSVHGTPVSRSFHTLARNRSFFPLQQQRRLKGSLATDGSTLVSENSQSVKSSDSTGRNDKTNMQVNSESASASSNDNSSQLQKDAKKVNNNSGVSFPNFTTFSALSILNLFK